VTGTAESFPAIHSWRVSLLPQHVSFGQRPFRVHIDPAEDGCDVVNTVADRIRAEFLRRIGLGDLLRPKS
jgi:hypothetical protein